MGEIDESTRRFGVLLSRARLQEFLGRKLAYVQAEGNRYDMLIQQPTQSHQMIRAFV